MILLKYIKSHSKDITKILTVEVELLDSFEIAASRFSRKLPRPSSEIENLEGCYKILSIKEQKCSYEDFYKKKITLITADDFAKEKEEENFRSKLMDIKRYSPLRVQEGNEKHMLYSLMDMKRDLRVNILNDKDIDEYAVFQFHGCHLW